MQARRRPNDWRPPGPRRAAATRYHTFGIVYLPMIERACIHIMTKRSKQAQIMAKARSSAMLYFLQ